MLPLQKLVLLLLLIADRPRMPKKARWHQMLQACRVLLLKLLLLSSKACL